LVLALFDVVAGLMLVVWPGVWQEMVHPLAMGTVFYPVQRHGALWLGRAGLTLLAARRPDPMRLSAVAAAWWLDVPGALLLAWRTAHTGPWAGAIHVALALVAFTAGVIVWRIARRSAFESKTARDADPATG